LILSRGNRNASYDAISGGTQLQNIAIAQTSSVANNRIASVNAVTYSYDASGNLTNDGTHTYQYDAAGRLANVDSGATASYSYGGNNWRMKKTSGGVTTHYLWEGAQVVAEYNPSSGALLSEYIYAGSRMITREQSGVLRYYHADRLSTRLITDSTGVVVGTEDHLPFGEDAGVVGENEKHRFTNYERDSESSTDYAVNRQHQFAAGRFMQPDPVMGNKLDPQTLNRYGYAASDPVNRTDPDGLYPRDQHQYITFIMAALLGRGDAGGIALGAGKADNFVNAATGLGIPVPGTGFTIGLGPIINFSKHFGVPATSIQGLSAEKAGFAMHLIEDNSAGGPHRFFKGSALVKRILSVFAHIGLDAIGKSPDRAGKLGGWEAAWVVLGGSVNTFPSDLISFIVNTVNTKHLEIIGVEVITNFRSYVALGTVDLTGAKLIASSVQNGVTVNIWQVPKGGSFYDDPGIQEIMRRFSYPGSNPVEEAYAIYLYSNHLSDGIGGWDDFETWFAKLR